MSSEAQGETVSLPPKKKPVIKLKKRVDLTVNKEDLHEWQKYAVNMLSETPDDRTVMWWYDHEGCYEKAMLIRYLSTWKNVILLSGTAGMRGAVKKYYAKNGCYPNIICCFYGKTGKVRNFDYQNIENLKDGLVLTRYGCLMPNPHVAVFANSEPDYSKLTWDKWAVCNLDVDPSGTLKKFASAEEIAH